MKPEQMERLDELTGEALQLFPEKVREFTRRDIESVTENARRAINDADQCRLWRSLDHLRSAADGSRGVMEWSEHILPDNDWESLRQRMEGMLDLAVTAVAHSLQDECDCRAARE